MKVVMRAATSRRSMPERRIAHAVSAMPPAPAVANSRVAAWPARLISVLARSLMRAAVVAPDGVEEHDVAEEGEDLEERGERQPAPVAVGDALPESGQVGERRPRAARRSASVSDGRRGQDSALRREKPRRDRRRLDGGRRVGDAAGGRPSHPWRMVSPRPSLTQRDCPPSRGCG